MFNSLIKFGLARLKLVMAGFALGSTALLVQLIEQHITMSLLGMPIPAEIKTAISVFMAGVVGNFTDNVELLPDGFAIPRATLPKLPAKAVELDDSMAEAPAA
jgi:hypothetical protein